MDTFSFLETTAEISVTFAGFISIFLVLARRDGSFDPGVAFLIRLVLASSVGCMFFAALPLLLAALSLEGDALWRVSSATMLAAGGGVSVYFVRRGAFIQRSRTVSIAYVLSGLVFLGLIANTGGWPVAPNAGAYVASVWLVLGIGSVYFVDLVVNRVLGPSDG